MKIHVEPLALQLETPFKLSYGATTVRENVLIHLEDGAYHGVGEAAVVPYYGETPERVRDYVLSPAVGAALDNDVLFLEGILSDLPLGASSAALAALDMALHDLWGQSLRQPLYRLWELDPADCPQNTFTVAMAEDEASYRQQLEAAAHYPFIKLKLGAGSAEADVQLVSIAREVLPQHRLCADANGAWTAEESLTAIPRLMAYDLAFIEQPVAREDFDGWRRLRDLLPADRPPLIADESVQGVQSVATLAGLADGINIKLAKCGGLHPARQMISLAKSLGLKVMLGCMVESSVAITAAAHLAPLVDFLDLDGNLLITNDPYQGAVSQEGRLTLPTKPGLGVERRAS